MPVPSSESSHSSWIAPELDRMGPETSNVAAHEPTATMFNNASRFKIGGGNFSNAAGHVINIVINSGHDIAETIRAAIPSVLHEVQKIQPPPATNGNTATNSFSSDDDATPEGGAAAIDMAPSSLLEIRSVADRYTRNMLKCQAGYPLYDPQAYSDLSHTYPRKGIRIGDLGIVTKDGAFDFLFNVCPSQNMSINPLELPDGFSLEKSEYSHINSKQNFPPKTHLFQAPLRRENFLLFFKRYKNLQVGGAILELPEGAFQYRATSTFPFRRLASRNAIAWYKYAMDACHKDILNGSLYLVTSCTKCVHWGIAVLDSSCAPKDSLRFVEKIELFRNDQDPKYNWKGATSSTSTKSGPSSSPDSNRWSPNQCVFIDGFKIMLRQEVFDDLRHELLQQPPQAPASSSILPKSRQRRVPATRVRGGAGPDPGRKRQLSDIWQNLDNVILDTNFNLPPLHPSDLINAALLKQQLGAKVALTHDNEWRDLVKGIFDNLDNLDLAKIAQSYSTSDIDENGCVCFERVPDRSLVIAIDVGTTFSSVSYSLLDPGSLKNQKPRIQPVTRFSGQGASQGNSKVPSIVCYDQYGTFIAAGSEADPDMNPSLSDTDGVRQAEWFKLRLYLPHLPADKRAEIEKLWLPGEPATAEDDGADIIDDKLLEIEGIGAPVEEPEPQRRAKHFTPVTNEFKDPVQVFADFLRYLFNSATKYIIETETNLDPAFSWNSIERNTHFVLTHPNGWKAEQQSQMRDAAVRAGLVNTNSAAERITFVTEGEANLYFSLDKNPNLLKEGNGILVADCGGGTIDLSAYSRAADGSFREIRPPGCVLQGSVFVTSRARDYFKGRFKDSKFKSDDDIEAMAKAFDKPDGVKCMFSNTRIPYYVKFGGLRDNDHNFGILSGRFKVEGAQVARFFEHAIQNIITGINHQCDSAKKNGSPIKSILLVGGFGSSTYLYTRLNEYFKPSRVGVLKQYNDHLTKAVADGAISFYLMCVHKHSQKE